jgi:rhamnosyltransferase
VSEQPVASIIIRTKNEEALLGDTLRRIYSQTTRDFEVIVVDSGSIDRTLQIARSFPTDVVAIPAAEFTYGRALNIGAAHARGEVLVALSAHALPLTDQWLARLLGHFADPRVAGVWGGQSAALDGPLSERVYTQDLATYLHNVFDGFSNANGAIRRALWVERPWREDLPGSEDKEWAYWALRAGYHLVHDGGATVFHHHRESVGQVWRRAHRERAGYAAFLDLPRMTLVDIPRRAYWRGLGVIRESPGMLQGLVRAGRQLPRIVAVEVGRYTGMRAGRTAPRVTASRGA